LSEVLCYIGYAFKRYDRAFVHGTVSKFYHDDELHAAKTELVKFVAQLPSAPSYAKVVMVRIAGRRRLRTLWT